jgi:D-alanyl-D-alanine carboxypeptidase
MLSQMASMRILKVKHLLLLGCFLISLSKNEAFSQFRYKGGKKHVSIGLNLLPASNIHYDINTPLSGPLKDSLDKKINELFAVTGMPGITAAMLVDGKGIWHMDTGFISRPAQQVVDTATVFYWASVSKLLTATIIAQLIQEKRLNYDSKLSEWFPQFQDAGKITIDELLKHTSGIYSFNNDSTFHYSKRYYASTDLIDIVLKNKNAFRPGEYWSYSNTGYLLLALIAEKIEGKPFAQIAQQRISDSLKLTTLKVLPPREVPPNLALAHLKGDVVTTDFSTPLGAGNVIANAKDMVVLLHALLTGKISTLADTQERLRDLYPMFDKGVYYGRGIMLYDFNEINNTDALWIGHSGGTETYRALLIYDVTTKAFLAVAVNDHIPVEAIARKLLEQIK